jgi:hypothetical protein
LCPRTTLAVWVLSAQEARHHISKIGTTAKLVVHTTKVVSTVPRWFRRGREDTCPTILVGRDLE